MIFFAYMLSRGQNVLRWKAAKRNIKHHRLYGTDFS